MNQFSFYNKDQGGQYILTTALYLNINNITHVPINTFMQFTNLIIISLRRNYLTIINSTMFKHNKQLREIDLSINKIHTFNLKLNVFPNLTTMYLNNNKLNVLNELMFIDFIKNSPYFTIYNNKYTCESDMNWLANMNNEFKSRIITEDDNCSSTTLNKTSIKCFIMKKSEKCHIRNVPTFNNG